MIRIMFVDDEAHVLSALRRALRAMRKEWDMAFETKAKDALLAMRDEPCDIVVSDLRMPEMDGVEFLEAVREHYPETVRLALSGQSDKMANFKAVGPVQLFLFKPCDAETLKAALFRAIQLSELLKDRKLKRLVSSMNTLPSLPSALNEMLEGIDRPDASTDSIGALIAQDVSMSAKILQLVNSSFFGVRHQVASPRDATILLGLDTIQALVLSTGVFDQFDQKAVDDLLLEKLWDHSIEVGRVAELIALEETGDEKLSRHVLTAGLLHDVGKLVFASCMPAEYSSVLKSCSECPDSQVRVENRVIGTSHARVGGYLLGLWGFSEPVVEAIVMHHEPRESAASGFVPLTAVHAANCIVRSRNLGGDPTPMDLLDVEYLGGLGLLDRFPAWQEKSGEVYKED